MIYSQELKDRTFKAYGDDIGSGVVRRHELEEKVLAYYRRTTPSLQEYYSRYTPEWDAFYSSEHLPDMAFLQFLKQMRSAFKKRYELSELNIDYYIQLPDALEKEMNPEVYSLVKELKQMRNEDQGIRLLLIDASKRYGDRDKRTVEIRQMMKRIDSKNALRVQQIIDLYGWLGSDELGEDANETLFLCIQHADDLIIQTKYLPILKKAMEEGNADGWQYAFLTDRIKMNRGEKQVYGTQTLRMNGKQFPVPIENPDKVDTLRKEIGLEPMKEYMEDTGFDWSLENYRKELPEMEKSYRLWFEKNRQQHNETSKEKVK